MFSYSTIWLLCAFNHLEVPFKCRRSSLSTKKALASEESFLLFEWTFILSDETQEKRAANKKEEKINNLNLHLKTFSFLFLFWHSEKLTEKSWYTDKNGFLTGIGFRNGRKGSKKLLDSFGSGNAWKLILVQNVTQIGACLLST